MTTFFERAKRWLLIGTAAFGVYVFVGNIASDARQDTLQEIRDIVNETSTSVHDVLEHLGESQREHRLGVRCSDRQILLALEDLAKQAELSVEAINPPRVSGRNCDLIFRDLVDPLPFDDPQGVRIEPIGPPPPSTENSGDGKNGDGGGGGKNGDEPPPPPPPGDPPGDEGICVGAIRPCIPVPSIPPLGTSIAFGMLAWRRRLETDHLIR